MEENLSHQRLVREEEHKDGRAFVLNLSYFHCDVTVLDMASNLTVVNNYATFMLN